MDQNSITPYISVIMPTHNTEISILKEAIESILNQTFTNFELIIIDDCSQNDSPEYLASLSDKRIRIITNKVNLGITKSLNLGLKSAKGDYIARMDADDISFPERFKRQLDYMEHNPNVIVCGTWIQVFGNANYTQKRVIPDNEYLRCSMLFGNQYGLCHPTAFFRASEMRKNKIQYDEELPTAQDYGMWVSCSEYGMIKNVEEILLKYRVHGNQISAKKREVQRQCTHRTQEKVFFRAFPHSSKAMFLKHCDYCDSHIIEKGLFHWTTWLIEENKKTGFFDSKAFAQYIEDHIVQRVINSAKTDNSIHQLAARFREMPPKYMPLYLKTLSTRLVKRARKANQ